jgi:hypothetical protein
MAQCANLHDILTDDAMLIEENTEAAQDPYEDQPVLVFDWINDEAVVNASAALGGMEGHP